jgi:nucleotide-binding universal stress UspA family protein
VPAFPGEVPPEEYSEEIVLKKASAQLKPYFNRLAAENKSIASEECVNLGFAVDSIINTAAEKSADLIVMGTKGSSGVETTLIGSNAASVMEDAPCPVLAIPSNALFKGIHKILYATDYRDSDLESIRQLSDIAVLFDAEILVVHMGELGHSGTPERDQFYAFEKKVIAEIPYARLSFQYLVGVNIAYALNNAVKEFKADIVALSMRRRSMMAKLFERSLTKKMIYHTDVPVLAFHSKA